MSLQRERLMIKLVAGNLALLRKWNKITSYLTHTGNIYSGKTERKGALNTDLRPTRRNNEVGFPRPRLWSSLPAPALGASMVPSSGSAAFTSSHPSEDTGMPGAHMTATRREIQPGDCQPGFETSSGSTRKRTRWLLLPSA